MSETMDMIKAQMDSFTEMYRTGFKAGLEEGRRQVFAEMAVDLRKIQEVSNVTI